MPNGRPGFDRLDMAASLCREYDKRGYGTIERNGRIADKLKITRATVRNYLSQARRHGLLEPADPHRPKDTPGGRDDAWDDD